MHSHHPGSGLRPWDALCDATEPLVLTASSLIPPLGLSQEEGEEDPGHGGWLPSHQLPNSQSSAWNEEARPGQPGC